MGKLRFFFLVAEKEGLGAHLGKGEVKGRVWNANIVPPPTFSSLIPRPRRRCIDASSSSSSSSSSSLSESTNRKLEPLPLLCPREVNREEKEKKKNGWVVGMERKRLFFWVRREREREMMWWGGKTEDKEGEPVRER